MKPDFSSLSLPRIKTALAERSPRLVNSDKPVAAVALVLNQARPLPEVLLIKRAKHEQDPWSGHLAFPGGRIEPKETSFQAAIRECFEETGLDLAQAQPIGRLDDLTGYSLPMVVACHVFETQNFNEFQLDHEVEKLWWVGLDRFLDKARQKSMEFTFKNQEYRQPALDLFGPIEPMLWGLTYRFCRNFFALLGHELPKADDQPMT